MTTIHSLVSEGADTLREPRCALVSGVAGTTTSSPCFEQAGPIDDEPAVLDRAPARWEWIYRSSIRAGTVFTKMTRDRRDPSHTPEPTRSLPPDDERRGSKRATGSYRRPSASQLLRQCGSFSSTVRITLGPTGAVRTLLPVSPGRSGPGAQGRPPRGRINRGRRAARARSVPLGSARTGPTRGSRVGPVAPTRLVWVGGVVKGLETITRCLRPGKADCLRDRCSKERVSRRGSA